MQMRSSLLSIAILLILGQPAIAGGRRRTATSPAPAEELSIVFVGMSGSSSDALFDAGVASRPRGVIVRTFGIRLDAGTRTTGTVVLRVWLESYDGRSTIRIDGMPLGTLPRVLDAHAPLGHVTTHKLEIEVPANVSEGTFASSIRWDASTD
jgi:hypothetical protein